MFRRQLRLAWLPSLTFSVCVVVAICHHDTSEGSATSGYVRDGHYFLSLGHGTYQETDATHFAAIRRSEWIVIGSLAGAVASAFVAAYLIRRAGLPIRADEIVPPLPPLLRPKPSRHRRSP